MKRKSEAEATSERVTVPPPKRLRLGSKIHLLDLSDELLLRSLSYLPVDELTRCERVCHKLRGLAQDNELWREKYYQQYVRRRIRRNTSLKFTIPTEQESATLRHSTRKARWLDDAYRIDTTTSKKWKQVFKVKYNWSKGRARTSEVQVGAASAVLAKVHCGYLYTVDHTHGVRVWKHGKLRTCLSISDQSFPSALDVSTGSLPNAEVHIVVGYASGLLSVLLFADDELSLFSTHQSNTGINSVALSWPYILTMSCSSTIELLQFSIPSGMTSLTHLHCDANLSPASLSLRQTKSVLVAGIAYAFNRFNAGWCLGLQEVKMDLEGGAIVDNRTTSSISTRLRESFPARSPHFTSRSTSTSPFSLHPELMRAPNSLSYRGCYILAGLPDNTLMVYTVTSTDDALEINVGRRLWGHTSAVSAAEVTSTGKALSISAKSDEMRYWELEELLSSTSQKRTSTPIHPLNDLTKILSRRGNGLGLAVTDVRHETDLLRRSVTFDDEQAVVVGERNQRQVISCFDFA